MASVERLLRLLLRQIDRHPKGALDSVDLADAEPAFVERLLTDRIITEEIPLQDVAPDPASQDELPLPIWRRGERAIAFSIEAGSAPEPVDPRELVQYPIDVLRLCTAIRKDNNLSGSGPEVLSHRTILIGWKSDKLGRRPVVLCRLLRDGNAYETVHMLASRLNTDRLILVSPTERTLGVDLLNSLRACGVQIVPAELALEGSIAQPFALRLEEWGPRASSAPDADVALFMETAS